MNTKRDEACVEPWMLSSGSGTISRFARFVSTGLWGHCLEDDVYPVVSKRGRVTGTGETSVYLVHSNGRVLGKSTSTLVRGRTMFTTCTVV